MPIYEYQCTACGHQLEAFQKMSEEPLTDCPKCNQPALNKLVSAAGFQLKGSGWYVTDYSNKGKAKQESANSESANSDSTSATEATKTAETKPADKPAPASDKSSGDKS